jgi:hypothetical protein
MLNLCLAASWSVQVLGVGGFNSWLYDQPSLYFFDVASNPAQPKFIKSVTPEKGAVADDFIRLPNGGFLVSLMGNKQGEIRYCGTLVYTGLPCWKVLCMLKLPTSAWHALRQTSVYMAPDSLSLGCTGCLPPLLPCPVGAASSVYVPELTLKH